MPISCIDVTGEYQARQLEANGRADLYFEQHLNSWSDPSTNYAYALINPSAMDWARSYVARCAKSTKGAGVHTREATPRQPDARGRGNLKHLEIPGILAEPGFVSHAPFAKWACTDEGVEALAMAAVGSFEVALPRGGVVALSIGHAGQPSRSSDKGAAIVAGGVEWESELAAMIVCRIKELLG